MVLRRIIFSVYVDIPDSKLVSHHESKERFNEHYDWLLEMQTKYAKQFDIEYRHYTYDEEYVKYQKWFNKEYPEITEYNIVNFYKLYLLYKLAEEYDEILYLDFDVIPVTKLNFFDEWDLSKGIAIMIGTAENQREVNELDTFKYVGYSIRSPLAKFWNTKAMLNEIGVTINNKVFNTGIIGASKERLHELDYFGNFEDTLKLMTTLIYDDGFYPDSIKCLFGYDNETIWGYKMVSQNLPFQNLTDGWHHFMYKWDYIPKESKLIHCVTKNFQYVKDWYEKNNL